MMSSRNRLVLVLLVGAWISLLNRGVAASHVCDDVCGSGNDCDAECWLTQFDYDNELPSTTCGEQNYSCCGDGMCDVTQEGCNACTDDCNSVSTCDQYCYVDSNCGSGQKCNPAHQCVDPSDNSNASGTECTHKNECNGNDVCADGDCTIPDNTMCGDSPLCWNNYDCDYPFQFCDPGIQRCQWVIGPGCPE